MKKNKDLDELVLKAVSYIDKDTKGLRIGLTGYLGFDILLQNILSQIEDLEAIQTKFKISRQILQKKTIKLLNDIKKEKKVIPRFYEGLKKIRKELEQLEVREYSIGFPINFKYREKNKCPSTFSIFDYSIYNLSLKEWNDRFYTVAQEGGASIQDAFKETPMDPSILNSMENTYWGIKINARDTEYAIDEVEKALEILFGTINYAINYASYDLLKFLLSMPYARISEIRKPFIYIVLENGEYDTCYYSYDISKRKTITISDRDEKRINEILPKVQSLSIKNKIEKTLMMAFRSYQLGVTRLDKKEALLHFWRGLETLTLKKPEEGTKITLKRAMSIHVPEVPSLSSKIISDMARKRNKIVHEGLDVTVTLPDVEIIKSMLENLIYFYIYIFKDEFSYTDILFTLNNAQKSKTQLKEIKKVRKREVELVEKMIEWRENLEKKQK